MIIPIEIKIKIGEIQFNYNLNYDIQIENPTVKVIPIEIHNEDIKSNDKENE